MLLLNLLVNILVVALVLWLIMYLISHFLPEFAGPARVICGVVFIILCIYALLSLLGGSPFRGPLLFRY
jgi:putative Mn2+ efflux pump MntP